MVLGKANANRVVLVAGDLLMEQKADMNLFYVTEQHIFSTKANLGQELPWRSHSRGKS